MLGLLLGGLVLAGLAGSKKSTTNKVEFFENIMANYDLTPDEREFLIKEREAMIRRGPTKTMIANQGIKENIFITLKENGGLTAKGVGDLIKISPQKAAALLKQMVEAGQVNKTVVRGKPYFTINSSAIPATNNNSYNSNDPLDNLSEEELKEMARVGLQAKERQKMTTNLKKFILERDDYTCQACGASLHNDFNLKLEVDHIVPISKGGKTDPSNLQTLCRKCNRSKGAKPMEVFVGGN